MSTDAKDPAAVALGKKRWAEFTPEERKAHMDELRAKRVRINIGPAQKAAAKRTKKQRAAAAKKGWERRKRGAQTSENREI